MIFFTHLILLRGRSQSQRTGRETPWARCQSIVWPTNRLTLIVCYTGINTSLNGTFSKICSDWFKQTTAFHTNFPQSLCHVCCSTNITSGTLTARKGNNMWKVTDSSFVWNNIINKWNVTNKWRCLVSFKHFLIRQPSSRVYKLLIMAHTLCLLQFLVF